MFEGPLSLVHAPLIAVKAGAATTWHFDGTVDIKVTMGGASTIVFQAPAVYNINTLDGLPTGGFRWSGTASVGEVTSYVPTGGLVYAGSAAVSELIPFTASGGFVYAGSAETSNAFSFAPTGGFVYSGESPNVTRFTITTPTGGFVFSGTSPVNTYSAWHAPSGGYKFGGSAVMFMLAADYPATTENPRGDPFYGWSVNAENGAVTRYYRLPANSFCQLGGKTFVANEGGIYEYGADTDAGQPIRASVQFPKDDYDSNLTKRMEVTRFGLETNGKMRLKVQVNDQEPRYYLLKMASDSVHGTRVYLGKGLAGRYWGFRLDNVAGADFALDTAEFLPVASRTRHGV